MGLALVTGPTTEPVSIGEAKDHCRITTAEEDGLLAGYILAARKYGEGYTRRAFMTQTWDYTIPCRFESQIDLPLPPLQSVTSVSYVDSNGSPQVLAANQYVVYTDGTAGYIKPAYNVTWPDVRHQDAAITVRFVAGWIEGQFPDDLRQALLLLTGHFYENREIVAIGTAVTDIPMSAETLLSGYRSLRILS